MFDKIVFGDEMRFIEQGKRNVLQIRTKFEINLEFYQNSIFNLHK